LKKAVLSMLAILVLCAAVVGFSYAHLRNETGQFRELIFPVEDLKTGKQGYMDINGNIVIEPIYDIAYEFDDSWNGLAMVTNSEGWVGGLIDRKGNVVFPVRYSVLHYNPVNNTIVAGSSMLNSSGIYETRYGYYRLDGTMILPNEYLLLSAFIDGKAFAQKMDGYWYIIDASGNVVKELDESIKMIFYGMYSSGAIAFTRTDPNKTMDDWGLNANGFIDAKGDILFEINDRNTYVTSFENGRAVIDKVVNNTMKAFVIDTSGAVIADLGKCSFYRGGTGGFKNGIACGMNLESGGSGAIDSDGRWIVEPKYQRTYYSDGIIMAKANDSHYLFFDKKGNKLWECGYPCTYYAGGYLFILKDDRFYMLDGNGKTVMPLPEGYMPTRQSYSSEWDKWRSTHMKTE